MCNLSKALIDEMGACNECTFIPTVGQQKKLEELCANGRVKLLLADPKKVALLVDGEAGDREEWITSTGCRELAQINELLCKIFCEG